MGYCQCLRPYNPVHTVYMNVMFLHFSFYLCYLCENKWWWWWWWWNTKSQFKRSSLQAVVGIELYVPMLSSSLIIQIAAGKTSGLEIENWNILLENNQYKRILAERRKSFIQENQGEQTSETFTIHTRFLSPPLINVTPIPLDDLCFPSATIHCVTWL